MQAELLRLEGLVKYYGAKLVLDGVHLSLNDGQRVALVGENGIGKTTLFRIITGAESVDSGTIKRADGLRVGYLPQEITTDSQTTVQHYIEQVTGDLATLREKLHELEQRMTESLSAEAMQAVFAAYDMTQAAFERRGGYDLDARMSKIFAGLQIDYIDPARRLDSLSGGERTRVALAALLLQEPDVLLLDEPTNHLDFAGIEWLEQYLTTYPHALLLITHDRTFINRVAGVICELNARTRTLMTYHGSYEDYLEQRNRDYQQKVETYNAQQNQIKSMQSDLKQLHHSEKTTGVFSDSGDKFLRAFKKGRGEVLTRKKTTDTRRELDELQQHKMSNPRHEWHIEFRFNPEPLTSTEPVVLNGLSKSFGDTLLFRDANLSVQKGDRVVLMAPNGSGKSTLLQILLGLQTADSGSFVLRGNVGYLDQNGEELDDTQTVLECYRDVRQGSDSELLAELHRSGLFSDATLGETSVASLSMGQRRKLDLARLIASRASVLLLDEPTNHLDPLSLEALEAALVTFDGALLAVSHDRRFVQKVATRIWRIEDGQLIDDLDALRHSGAS